MHRKLILLLLTIGSALFAQQARTDQWKVYKFPTDGFLIVAPSEPRIYPDPKISDLKIYHWDLASGVILTLRAGVRPDCQHSLEQMTAAVKRDQSGSFVPGSVKDVSHIGMPGTETESHHASYWSVERVYCGKDKAYALSVAYPVNKPRPTAVDRILNSFSLLADPQQR